MSNPEEMKEFMSRPVIFAQGITVPLDINYKTSYMIIGPPKSGKTLLAKRLSAAKGMVYLRVSAIIKEMIEMDCKLGIELRKNLQEGGEISDDMVVKLLQKRIQMKDCIDNGWILEGFPKTFKQCQLLVQNGIIPDVFFSIQLPKEEKLKRIKAKKDYKFGLDARVLASRIELFEQEVGRIESFFALEYDNLRRVDGIKSPWFMEDFALTEARKIVWIKQTYAKNYQKKDLRPIYLLQIHMNKILKGLTRWNTLCPVCFRHEKKFIKCKTKREFILEKDGQFLYTCCNQHMKILIESYKNFSNTPANIWENMAFRVPLPMAAEKAKEGVHYMLEGHCPVTLLEAHKIERGNPLSMCRYKNVIYSLVNHYATNKFLETPSKYEPVKLPAKLPVTKEKVKLSELVHSTSSIPFLEETLGQLLTNGLLEIGSNRYKYPTLTVKETALKLFALYLKANNPNNTPYMAKKYKEKMRKFIEDCQLPCRIHHETLRKGNLIVNLPRASNKERNKMARL